MLVEGGVRIDKKTATGETALMIAIKTSNTASCRKLLELGADVDLGDSSNDRPLFFACSYGCLEIIKRWLEYYADVDNANPNRRRSLHTAMDKTIRISRRLKSFSFC
jgi:uncharacterized protein